MRRHILATLTAVTLPYVVATVALIIVIIGGEVLLAVLVSPAGPTEAPAVPVAALTAWVIPGAASMTAVVVGTRLPYYLRPEHEMTTMSIIAATLAALGVSLGPFTVESLLSAAAPAVGVLVGYWWGRSRHGE